MKAEHRKELQTNSLADKVGGIIKGAKSYAGAVWALVIIGVVAYLFYWWYSSNYANRISLAWIDLLNASEASRSEPLHGTSKTEIDEEIGKLEEQKTRLRDMADRRKGTTAEKPGRLLMADLAYRQGFMSLDNIPSAAKVHLDEAKGIYEIVASNPGDCKDLGLRALVAIGRCQESMGEIEAAKETYNKVLNVYGKQFRTGDDGPAHPLIKEAEKALAFLQSDFGQRLYDRWLTRHGVSRPTEKPGDKPPEKVPEKPIEPPPPPE